MANFTTDGLLYPLTKGDTLGHDFHGNQWQVVGANGQPVDKPNRFVKLNRFAGQCAICGTKVEAGAGGTSKSRDGKWNTYCRDDIEKHGVVVPTSQGLKCAFCHEAVELYTTIAGKTYVASGRIDAPHGRICLSATQSVLERVNNPEKTLGYPDWGTPERQAQIAYAQDKADRAAREYAYFAKK